MKSTGAIFLLLTITILQGIVLTCILQFKFFLIEIKIGLCISIIKKYILTKYMYMHAMLVKKNLHDSKNDIACRIDHKVVLINEIDIGLI